MSQPNIYTWAADGFDTFSADQFWEFSDFWTRGNTFEACIRFVTAARAKWPTDPQVREMGTFLQQMCGTNAGYFNSVASGPEKGTIWADDFGWWGIAALAARDYLIAVGDPSGAADQLEIAKTSFTQMKARGWDPTDGAQPVPHGCANAPGPPPLPGKGTKNTVTNANLFVLSTRLYQEVKDTDPPCADACLAMAQSQYAWFSSWFAPGYDYLRLVKGSGGLVGERPHWPPHYCTTDHPDWEPGWVWTGDQGLLLGALAETLQIKDALGVDPQAVEVNVTQWISTIVQGIRSLLVGTDDVLREAPFESAYDSDPKDYVCGRGVLMRYLAEGKVRGLIGGVLDKAIAATATAVWESRDPTTKLFGPDWSPANDQAFNQSFVAAWGNGDAQVKWGPNLSDPVVKPIVQALGLDVIGAAIPVV